MSFGGGKDFHHPIWIKGNAPSMITGSKEINLLHLGSPPVAKAYNDPTANYLHDSHKVGPYELDDDAPFGDNAVRGPP